jgi:hypothetical protein
MLKTEQRLRRQQELFPEILPEGETGFGLDPSWVSLYPYQALVVPGRPLSLQVRARNYYNAPMKLEAMLIAPREWKVTPDIVKLDLAAGSTAKRTLEVQVPTGWRSPSPRFAIALDVVRNGRYLGQITEAVCEIAPAL